MMRTPLLWASLAITGCDELATGTVGAAELGCVEWGCKTNTSITADGHIFHDHDLGPDGTGGVANSGGLRITGIQAADGQAMSLGFFGEHLDQLAGKVAGQTKVNDELIGMRIALTDGRVDYYLELEAFDRVRFWVGGGDAPAYKFTVYRAGARKDRLPLCRAEYGDVPGWGPLLSHYAVAFRGDHYDAHLKTVTVVTETDTWFNLACAGTAPAKLHLLRHTTAGGIGATQPERQAMFKLLVADYCGDGTVYTEDGHALAYADHWYHGADPTHPDQRKHLESLWTATGAQCLDEPRLFELPKIHCKPRRCRDNVAGWELDALAASVNPPAS